MMKKYIDAVHETTIKQKIINFLEKKGTGNTNRTRTKNKTKEKKQDKLTKQHQQIFSIKRKWCQNKEEQFTHIVFYGRGFTVYMQT